MQPTLAGFITFARNVMGISSAQLPDDSPYFGYAFNVAMEIVSTTIAAASALMYQLAVYNLAGDNLLNYAQDPSDAPIYPANNAEGTKFFQYMRKEFNLLGFVSGVISSSGDEGTSQSLVTPEAFKQLMISNLQNLKTPYGRTYLGIAQRYGDIWGVS